MVQEQALLLWQPHQAARCFHLLGQGLLLHWQALVPLLLLVQVQVRALTLGLAQVQVLGLLYKRQAP